jgi:alpha-N-acetylglucosamine transferase
MKGNYAFVSIITSDNYLPGLLVLHASLSSTDSVYPFHVLLTSEISEKTLSILNDRHISYSVISQKIQNPTDVSTNHRWFSTYSKLFVFDQTQYEKIVYLDADMLILRNIDELFSFSHMSATNAGGMLPRKASWTHLNSGVFVLEPSHLLFTDMVSKIGKIEKLESGGSTDRPRYGSDQDFLNAYYPDWPQQTELHLDHKYNIFHYYLDEYNKLFGYTIEDGSKPISIIHYASYLKPWNIGESELNELRTDPNRQLELSSIQLWLETYKNIKS